MDDDDDLTVRCFCRRKPVLAKCGRDSRTGQPFIHIRSAKGDRINAEAVVVTGEVRLRCRECLRWTTIVIRTKDVAAKPEPLPRTIQV